nr:hypothetical protein [Haloglomus salinum]
MLGHSSGSRIESDGSSLLPLDSEDEAWKRVESALDDIQRMRIDEPGALVDDGRRAIVDLEMDRAEIVMRIVLMPTDQETPLWLDPVEPVVLVRLVSLQLKPDLDSRRRYRIRIVIQELPRVQFPNHAIWPGFARFGTPSSDVVEHSVEPIADAVMEPFAL